MKNLTFACLDQPYRIKSQKQPDVVKTTSNCTKWRRPENANVLTPYVCKLFMIIILNYAIIRSYRVAVAPSRRVAKLSNQSQQGRASLAPPQTNPSLVVFIRDDMIKT
jgi:hypothetical protein